MPRRYALETKLRVLEVAKGRCVGGDR
ncbi:hypothetical protein GN958_ATG01649 [Phytophthora infestans]|uniref:Transposase n=1 Tax=Phytophthora infestans TaxID=4787 RepID=A0A8S9VEQ3_PHYIN|nr:hypothetical protein GN958_ATG01649 [Phytophthora infestans]